MLVPFTHGHNKIFNCPSQSLTKQKTKYRESRVITREFRLTWDSRQIFGPLAPMPLCHFSTPFLWIGCNITIGSIITLHLSKPSDRAVASLTIPGGQNFDQFFLLFLKLFSLSSSLWLSGRRIAHPGRPWLYLDRGLHCAYLNSGAKKISSSLSRLSKLPTSALLVICLTPFLWLGLIYHGMGFRAMSVQLIIWTGSKTNLKLTFFLNSSSTLCT